MIILISGKIGSGKDTVAKMIQNKCKHKKFEIKSWADKLKEVCSIIMGCPIEELYTQEGKASVCKLYPKFTKREIAQKIGTDLLRNQFNQNVWVNALLCDYGTRPLTLFEKIHKFFNKNKYPNNVVEKNWIIPDTRFKNELRIPTEKYKHNTLTVRVNGDPVGVNAMQTNEARTHISETDLDDIPAPVWNFIIANNGTLLDLEKQVDLFIDYYCLNH